MICVFVAAVALGFGSPTDEAVRKILAERVDARKQSTGMVVGIVDESGQRFVAYGSAAKNGAPMTADTLFEIGSITKVFTAQLLADAVARGVVKLDDPVSKLLPGSVKMPEKNGRAITLLDLATHRSGLPRLPEMTITDMSNPYAAFTVDQMYSFLSKHELRREPGAEFEYSNFGAGLLGHVLARQAGTDYESLLRRRVLGPLGMKSTAIVLSPELKARMAQGHDAKLQPVPNWDLPTLAGAGALRSSAADMLKFVAAHLAASGGVPASMLATRRPATGNTEVGLGWMIAKRGSKEVVWHNGGTGGFQSFIGFDRVARVGVVVLSNSQAGPPGVDDIGHHLLDETQPLVGAKKERREISFDATKFDAFVGHYQLAPKFVMSVMREGDRFYTQATGQQKIEIFAMGDRVFFPKVVDAELEFTLDASGKASKMTLRQNGGVLEGARVEAPVVLPERKSIEVDAKVLDGYVGKYQLAPGMTMAITREGGRLFAQVTGQDRAEVFAESDSTFFFKVVEAELSFRPGAVTLRQAGVNVEAKRVE